MEDWIWPMSLMFATCVLGFRISIYLCFGGHNSTHNRDPGINEAASQLNNYIWSHCHGGVVQGAIREKRLANEEAQTRCPQEFVMCLRYMLQRS